MAEIGTENGQWSILKHSEEVRFASHTHSDSSRGFADRHLFCRVVQWQVILRVVENQPLEPSESTSDLSVNTRGNRVAVGITVAQHTENHHYHTTLVYCMAEARDEKALLILSAD